MREKSNVCFSANRICHHDDYYLLISRFDEVINVKNLFLKVKFLFSSKTIYFLDIDKGDLFLTPLIVLRSLWGGKGFGLSVRTEYLVDEISFKDFFSKMFESKYPHMRIKQFLFLIIKNFSLTKLISIHKGHPEISKMSRYVNYFMYDPQLWDLKFLNLTAISPPEVKDSLKKNSVLIAGSFNEQRSRSELLHYLDQTEGENELQFIIASKLNNFDYEFLNEKRNVLIINRYISNEELYFLFLNTEIIYCFYTNNRPSGFFGRAVQLNKKVIVRRNSFLDLMFPNYPRKIVIDSLIQLDSIKNHTSFNDSILDIYDDSQLFSMLIKP